MIAHHAQAIVMASWAPTHGARPNVARLCKKINVAQRDEIATMRLAQGAGDPIKVRMLASEVGDLATTQSAQK